MWEWLREDMKQLQGKEERLQNEKLALLNASDGVDNSAHWISKMLPPPLPALPVNAKDIQDILFPTEETCKLPVLPRVYRYYQQQHPDLADKFLVKGDDSKFCITVSNMLQGHMIPPNSDVDVTMECGGVIKKIFHAFCASRHPFAHKVLLNREKSNTTSGSIPGATKKQTRPDTLGLVSDCTFLVGKDKLGRLRDAQGDLESMMMPLPHVLYGEVSGILCYAAAQTTFQWLFPPAGRIYNLFLLSLTLKKSPILVPVSS